MKTTLILATSILAFTTAALTAQEKDKGVAFDALRKRLDTDLDGRISLAEFPRGERAFNRLDRDRDGYLTAADFATAGAKPSSEAMANRKEATPEEIEFFEKSVRPVLANNCYSCHSNNATKLKAGLKVDSIDALLAGGVSGPAIMPGDADASLLITAVRYTDSDLAMPPKKQLDEAVVKDLEKWVTMGAPWPGAKATGEAAASATRAPKAPLDLAKAREFWAFKPPVRSEPPSTREKAWPWTPIDQFLMAAMEKSNLAPVADADKRTWLRRVTFDLTGLPPTPDELAAFEADKSPRAFESVVDRLLASPAYGERWGRHWLDVARYAESSGKDTNIAYPQAWRYRDWVIAAFNADKPYDQMLREQLAGDLLPSADSDARAANVTATGYLALGAKSHNTRDARQFSLDVADEQIDAVSQGMLGMTIACARCHDHKFDPIPTEDYYALAGIFLSTDTRFGTYPGPGNNNAGKLIELPADAHVPNGPTMEPAVRTVIERARDNFARQAEEARAMPRTGDAPGTEKKKDGLDIYRERVLKQQTALFDELLGRFDEKGRALPANRLAMGALEGKPRDIAVLDRGEVDKPGAIALRGMPQVLRTATAQPIKQGSGRKELADWIASSSNPLTARVWANRVWGHLFGAGIVRTPENFGASGQRPDHPELLDWLATELVAQGWSTKKLVREIVLSHAYRLDSVSNDKNAAVDPEARNLWRMPDRRLEAEAIRDAILSVAGVLQTDVPVGSKAGVVEGPFARDEIVNYLTREQPVRSIYLPNLRDHLPEALAVFDAPDSAFVTGDREETNVATQALFLMNDVDVMKIADAFADKVLAQKGTDDERIAYAFERALGRKPNGNETSSVRAFLTEFEKLAAKEVKTDKVDRGSGEERKKRRQKQAESPLATDGGESALAPVDPHRAAWSAFAQTLFQSAEFRSVG
ncbi:MAG: PSD1 and planctomycete cytochrome C domain-containing protein [Planctomycetota bacterium]|nr:PSD1 and planctomycete cytochrome C domain-containing protein [Planctomycetota bacterium]